MGRLAKVTACFAMLTAWAATSVSAQGTRFWEHVCGGTVSFQTCASVHVEAKMEGTQAVLIMHVWNESGGAVGGDAGVVINAIGLRNFTIGQIVSEGTVAEMSGTYRGSSAPASWRAYHQRTWNGTEYAVATIWDQTKSAPISNTCDPANPNTWTTIECSSSSLPLAGSVDFTGAVKIKFNMTTMLTQQQLDVAILGIRSTNSDGYTQTFEAVPEPITMVLLGTGLAGVGGAGLLRRRRRNGDIANS